MVIAKDVTLPYVSTDSLFLYGSGDECLPVGVTSSFIIYMFPVTSCGTVQSVRTTALDTE